MQAGDDEQIIMIGLRQKSDFLKIFSKNNNRISKCYVSVEITDVVFYETYMVHIMILFGVFQLFSL